MKIYVINLDRDAERLAWMHGQLSARGLDYERFPAVTPDTIPDRVRARFHARAAEILLPGEIACFASHIVVAERLLASDAPCCLVLEDDVEILCSGDALRALAERSARFDIVKLNDWPKTPTLGLERVGGHQIVRYFQAPRGTGSFFLTRRGAERLLARATDLATVADYFLREEAYLHLDVAGVTPPPIPQDRFGASSLDPTKRRGKARSRLYFYAPDERLRGLDRALGMIRTIGMIDLARLTWARLAMRAAGVKRDVELRYVLPMRSGRREVETEAAARQDA